MITLTIPTLNRPEHLERQLLYYADVGFDGHIFIGDSSTPENIARTKAVVERLSDRLRIVHYECRQMTDAQTLRLLAGLVRTPYVTLVPDDDFQVPSGLARCVEFLEGNTDFCAAHGQGIAVLLEGTIEQPVPAASWPYEQPRLEGDTAGMRLTELFNHYCPVVFSVHRADTWRAMWQPVDGMNDRAFAAELFPCLVSAVSGKLKALDVLSLIRLDHAHRYHLPASTAWYASPEFLPSYQAYVEQGAALLARQDGLHRDAARAIVVDTLRRFAGWPPALVRPRLTGFRRLAGSVPGLRAVAAVGRTKREKVGRTIANASRRLRERQFALSALLRPSSVYHTDFQPVYRALNRQVRPVGVQPSSAT